MKTPLIILILLFSGHLFGQHTFSIVAVDPLTNEVGGAGATCYQTVNDIADVHPGVGFIHTQSYVNADNQQYAKTLMNQGLSPQQIMDSLQANDAENNSTLRQYAAVDLVNGGRSAAFTGSNCYNYKGQRLGANYAIAGNILLGPEILDSMEARFLATSGSLADKLMAALQGAKVPGADSRCANDGVSSLSAYIIVSKPTDIAPDFYLNLNVENVLPTDPIDVLQQEYDNWKLTGIVTNEDENRYVIYPNPTTKNNGFQIEGNVMISNVQISDYIGKKVYSKTVNATQCQVSLDTLLPGIYFCEIENNKHQKDIKKLIIK